mgnify:CR=1 FL=1
MELVDNSLIAYLAYPDMRIPISYALNEETRRSLPFGVLDTTEAFRLTFYPPDVDRFPSLKIALDAVTIGDGAVIAMNAANEVASQAFIHGKIKFTEIPQLIEKTLDHLSGPPIIENVKEVLDIHQRAAQLTEEKIRKKI